MNEALVLLLLFLLAVVFYVPLVVVIGRFWIEFAKSLFAAAIRFSAAAKDQQSA